MESRIAIIGIIVEDIDASSKVNDIYMIMECIFWEEWGYHTTRRGLTLSASQLMHRRILLIR
nr:hypothetical protein [Anaerostipes hadrus]